MTFKLLKELIEKNNIPEDVALQSDSGWECDETEMNGVYYNAEENIIIFTQCESEEYKEKGYQELYAEKDIWRG